MISRPNVKVNLGLRILRKRSDGYHDIETLLVPCHEFNDSLEIIKGDDYSRTSASLFARYGEDSIAQGISPDGKIIITIARANGVDWDPQNDLCAKAYSLLDKEFGLPPVKIFLEKGSPVGAGLGGGSADAAFTLRMLGEMFSLNLSDTALAAYASHLGSDCPFFIYNRPMIGTGRGEILEPYDINLEDYELKLLVPEGVAISTAEAYRGVSPKLPPESLRDTLSRPIHQWKNYLVNDFEASVFPAHPELSALKQSLYNSGAVYASLSGSGSALFALYGKNY